MAAGTPERDASVPRRGTGLPGARRALSIPLLLAAILIALPAAAQTAPGTEITNIASASFPPGPPGNSNTPIRIQSNMVRTVVAELGCVDAAPSLTVSPSGTVAPGDTLTYTVRAVFAGTPSDNVMPARSTPAAPTLATSMNSKSSSSTGPDAGSAGW